MKLSTQKYCYSDDPMSIIILLLWRPNANIYLIIVLLCRSNVNIYFVILLPWRPNVDIYSIIVLLWRPNANIYVVILLLWHPNVIIYLLSNSATLTSRRRHLFNNIAILASRISKAGPYRPSETSGFWGTSSLGWPSRPLARHSRLMGARPPLVPRFRGEGGPRSPYFFSGPPSKVPEKKKNK